LPEAAYRYELMLNRHKNSIFVTGLPICLNLEVSMKKHFMALILLIVSVLPCFAEEQEMRSFRIHPDHEPTITLKGYFHIAGAVSPGQNVFHYLFKGGNLVASTKYSFVRSTGNKSFELQKEEQIIYFMEENNCKYERTKINGFFDSEKPMRLEVTDLGLKHCQGDDKIYMKMIALEGNQLTYQILLPECLKTPDKK